ncbi:MAG TPA: winged helix-turn-helix transcriptional regulator [Streptosporangiaceae bacterium]|jgi:DNA-binding HxlR family transcriptional regulator
MMSKRLYDDGCGIAHAMNLIGERWAVLVVRELLLGPKRFTDLQTSLPGAGPNILSQRLRDLEATGVLRRATLPPPSGARVYELTDWGARLGPILAALSQWGNACPTTPPSGPIGADSLMLGLRSAFQPAAGDSWTATYDIAVGRDRFTGDVADGELDLRRGAPHRADAALTTDTDTLAAMLRGQQTLAQAIKNDRVTIRGDRPAVEKLFAATGKWA